MRLSIKQYIDKTIRGKAKITYDKSIKQWYGVLHHEVGSVYSQKKTKSEVTKEMTEILEEFIALSLEGKGKVLNNREVKTPKIQGAYR